MQSIKKIHYDLLFDRRKLRKPFVRIALLICVILIAFPAPHALASPRLSVGRWWSSYGDYQLTGSETGGDAGSYAERSNFTARYLALNASADGDQMTFLLHVEGTSTCSAVGPRWKCNQQDSSWSSDRYYTVSLSTNIVTYYVENGKVNSWGVGHHVWFMVDPVTLSVGGTTPYMRCTPTSDYKQRADDGTDVQAAVSTANMNVKGNTMKVWVLSYTGATLGQFKNNNGVWSAGTENDSLQYDPAYGVFLGGTFSDTAIGKEVNGSPWTDSYIEHDYFKDTDLAFNAVVTIGNNPAGATVTAVWTSDAYIILGVLAAGIIILLVTAVFLTKRRKRLT
jgi:hypothetical protein